MTRLLIDYEQRIQDDIFDILFKPQAGASLQIIKVEIGEKMLSSLLELSPRGPAEPDSNTATPTPYLHPTPPLLLRW